MGTDLTPANFEQAWRFSEIIANSGLCPKNYFGKPADVFVAMQWGAELGLKPLQALQNIAVINGRPCVWGDALLALVVCNPVFESINETDDGQCATCTIHRKGWDKAVIRTFSMADAKLAGLAGKQGPWQTNPPRMRQMRARAFALRDSFPDVLKGMQVREEVEDYEETDITPQAFQIAEQPQPQVVALPHYPQETFEKNFPQWSVLIQSGKRTPDEIIRLVSTKGTLSAEQASALYAVAATTEHTAEYTELEG